MKMVVVAGTPGSGKTSVLMHAVKDLIRAGPNPALVKIDCMWTEDDARFKRLEVPVAVGLSKDMCPDHYAIYNLDEMLAVGRGPGGGHSAQRDGRAVPALCSLPGQGSGHLRDRCDHGPQQPSEGRAAAHHCRRCGHDQGRPRLPGGEGGLPGAHSGGQSRMPDHRGQRPLRQGLGRAGGIDDELAGHLRRDGAAA